MAETSRRSEPALRRRADPGARPSRRAARGSLAWLCALPLLLFEIACATPTPAPPRSPVECYPMLVRQLRPWTVNWIPGDLFTCANAVAIETHLRWRGSMDRPGMQPL